MANEDVALLKQDADVWNAWRFERHSRREGCGHDASLGQRGRLAHMPTAATAAGLRGLILGRDRRRFRVQLRNRSPWSHPWGPLQSTVFLASSKALSSPLVS